MDKWLQKIQEDIESIIFKQYLDKDCLKDTENDSNFERLQEEYTAFFRTIINLRYVPIQPPFFTLKYMVNEPVIKPEEFRISNLHFKSIFEFNFTEAVMLKPKIDDSDSRETIGPLPNVLSIAVTYQHNPLMWPLIFHEYGHAVYDSHVEKDKKNKDRKKRITDFCKSQKIDLTKQNVQNLNNCITEIYSDLFGIHYYGSNYFMSFYFHEILDADCDALLNFDETGIFQFRSHPPSLVRMDYMISELKKINIYDNNDCLKRMIKYHESFKNYIKKSNKKIPDEYVLLYQFIYNEISTSLKKPSISIDKEKICQLTSQLKNMEPIGTSPREGLKLKKALRSDGQFDIEIDNKIIDIITTGWNYLLLDLIQKSYDSYSTYPIKKFKEDYIFLMKNLNYSMETSVIVSGYLRKT